MAIYLRSHFQGLYVLGRQGHLPSTLSPISHIHKKWTSQNCQGKKQLHSYPCRSARTSPQQPMDLCRYTVKSACPLEGHCHATATSCDDVSCLISKNQGSCHGKSQTTYYLLQYYIALHVSTSSQIVISLPVCHVVATVPCCEEILLSS